MATILKIKYENDVHRVPLEDVTYDAIQQIVENLYPEKPVMKYMDDEKDLCTLCPATFADFVSLGAHAGEKTLLRLELSARHPVAPPTADELPAWKELRDLQGGLGSLFEALRGLKGKGKGKGKCKGKHHWEHPWEHHWEHHEPCEGAPFFNMFQFGGCGRLRCVVKIASALRQLHASGSLNAKTAAAVFANVLGKLASVATDLAPMIDVAAAANPEAVQKVMEELMPHVVAVEGLDHCAAKMEGLLSGDGKASEALLELLTSLEALPFGVRVSFLEGLYNSQQSRVDELLSKAGPFLAMMPPVETEHSTVICDGCNMSPLQGPRFKCKTKDDYDLCAACFADKETINGGECEGHEFKMITRTDGWGGKGWWCEKGKGKGKGKGDWEELFEEHGKGKGKGKGDWEEHFEAHCHGKGKCKGKGKWRGEDAEAAREPEGEAAEAEQGRRCASEGCTFVATWHSRHCCNCCQRHGPGKHGPRCQRVSCSVAEEAADVPAKTADVADQAADVPEPSAPPPDNVTCGPAVEPPANKQQFDLSVTVDINGRQLAIEWNLGDDVQQVAQKFVAEHDILPEELPTIQAFLESVMSTVGQNAK